MLSADPTPLPTPVFGMCSGGMRPTPMLGLRGVRLLTVIPELVDAQVRGLCEAVADLHEEGLDPPAEILVPLVADARELTAARHRIEAAVAEVASARQSDVRLPVGVMIELPRAALTARRPGPIGGVLLLRHQRPDPDHVGHLPRRRREQLPCRVPAGGACPGRPLRRPGPGRRGTAGGDGRRRGTADAAEPRPRSVRRARRRPPDHPLLATVGLDYVSSSPPRVPMARLEAGRAA